MKKVKIMLISLLLLAVVGGTLAFKAKFLTSYCYTSAFYDAIHDTWFCPVDLEAGDCPQVNNSTQIGGFGTPTISCTTARPIGGCAQVTSCTFITTLKRDFQ